MGKQSMLIECILEFIEFKETLRIICKFSKTRPSHCPGPRSKSFS